MIRNPSPSWPNLNLLVLYIYIFSTPPPLWPPTPPAPTASHCAHAPRKTEVCCVVKASTHGISVVQLDSPIESLCVTTAVLELRALLITAKWDWEESNTADNLQRMHPPCFCSAPMCCCGLFCWDCELLCGIATEEESCFGCISVKCSFISDSLAKNLAIICTYLARLASMEHFKKHVWPILVCYERMGHHQIILRLHPADMLIYRLIMRSTSKALNQCLQSERCKFVRSCCYRSVFSQVVAAFSVFKIRGVRARKSICKT